MSSFWDLCRGGVLSVLPRCIRNWRMGRSGAAPSVHSGRRESRRAGLPSPCTTPQPSRGGHCRAISGSGSDLSLWLLT